MKIFVQPFVSVRENLKAGVSICEQWLAACEHLTGQVAGSFAPNVTYHAEQVK